MAIAEENTREVLGCMLQLALTGPEAVSEAPARSAPCGRDRPDQAVLPETGPSSAVASMSLTSSRSTL